ncbi:MAG: phosphate ABC transporter permease subunit PstC [Clostridiales bacterium]|nr:phosphate ABC transporter permease subunit PstC [Clostridiales bacterium]MDY4895509.1 phosphate ABC transporter permease subunit PstC [Christensenellaceae bacterium]HAC10883.1 phosphate ABC transporter permease subunit PstC [Clostridiales bacterium]
MKSGYTLSVYTFIKVREKVMKGVFFICALFSVFALGTITVYLFSHGVPFISKIGFDKFFGDKWSLIAEPPSYGILPMLVTSLYVTALSVIIGVTIGLFTAVCLYKFCPKRLVAPISQTVNLLAGIPSVIFGLFGMTIVVPFLRDNVSDTGTGYGILAASIVLAIMILPTIVSVSLDAMRAVPQSYFEGALALGATKEQTTFKVLLPAAKSGIFAGIVLAIGRAIGETMAVIMVLGNSPVMPEGLFSSVRTLTANIALGATEISDPDAESALIATGVILFVFTLLLNICFTLLKQDKIEAEEKRAAKKAKRAAKNAAKKQAEAEKEQAV